MPMPVSMDRATRTRRWFRRFTARQVVVAVVAVQAAVLVVGAAAIFVQTRSAVVRSVAQEIQLGNSRIADDLAERMRAVLDGPIRPGGESWRRAQAMIERTGAGTVASALLLDGSGRVVCHPDLRTDGDVLGAQMGSWTVRPGEGGAEVDLTSEVAVSGLLDVPFGGTWYVTTRPIPELGATIVVRTPQSALASMVSPAMTRTWLALAAVGAGMLALTAVCATIVASRYDRRLVRLNRELSAEVDRRVEQGLALRNALIFGLAKLADYRDSDTGKHLERIAVYSELIALELAPAHAEITDAWIERLKLASSLHDIGKVGIPDVILLKPGKLTPDERRLMEEHAKMGADTLIAIRDKLGDGPLINMGIEVAMQHHEKWDGTGYPLGIRGESISLPGRIVALTDFYDAVTSKRVYKDAMTHQQAHELILENSGTHFDPEIVSAFRRRAFEFERQRARLQPEEIEVPHAEAVLLRLQESTLQREAA